jgi:NAD(P)-dependent dehydrogenase (short-subunit alcohol dehydrogenase family)
MAATGRRALVAVGDVTDAAYLARLMARIRDQLGSVDVAVAAAGSTTRDPPSTSRLRSTGRSSR